MRFVDVDEHELSDARPGVELMEKILADIHFTPFLYGLTTHQEVLLAAQESLEGEEEEGTPTLTEVAVAIPFGSDALYFLSGSGLKLSDEDFAYIAGGDGVRVHSFRSSHQPRVVVNDFTKLAVADDDSWLDDFFQQYGTAAAKSDTVVRQPIPATASKKGFVSPIDIFLR